MNLEITFTPKAKETFLSTIQQIQQKWDEKSAENL
jgi:hypothetical protein